MNGQRSEEVRRQQQQLLDQVSEDFWKNLFQALFREIFRIYEVMIFYDILPNLFFNLHLSLMKVITSEKNIFKKVIPIPKQSDLSPLMVFLSTLKTK